eukprot:2608827-Rhodomonas_salina.1
MRPGLWLAPPPTCTRRPSGGPPRPRDTPPAPPDRRPSSDDTRTLSAARACEERSEERRSE